MIRNHEEDEFVAVRVQDPRIQNEGSWNSYVDYKIFLHTNSKAFTAKTSCVRRRYSEFVWLKKKLQKNVGLVPVPDLPGKSFFSFSNEDFLESRRKGLQAFLDKVVHMTVCLSDSQLHLFLQTQLPIGHIEDCVQGLTPFSVTDSILTYASSNRGMVQAQEEDSIKEPSLNISYESMESPAPHQPCLQTTATFNSGFFSCGDSDPLEDVLELSEQSSDEMRDKEEPLIRISQTSNHLEAVVEECGPREATFYVGETQDDAESLSPPEQRGCLIHTPVEVHSPMVTDCEKNCEFESVVTKDTKETPDVHADSEEKENIEILNSKPEQCAYSEDILVFVDNNNKGQMMESEAGSQEEDVLEDVCYEKQVLDNQVTSGVHADHVTDINSDKETEPDDKKSDKLGVKVQISDNVGSMNGVPEVDAGGVDSVNEIYIEEVEQEEELVGTKDESDEISHSLSSSNESIIRCSEEESLCEEPEDKNEAADVYLKTSPVTHWTKETPNGSILDLHVDGCLLGNGDVSAATDEDLQYISGLSKSNDVNPMITDGDLAENSDFSILKTSCVPGLADNKCAEQEVLSSLSLDSSEEIQEVETH